jgi:hypothetical protein
MKPSEKFCNMVANDSSKDQCIEIMERVLSGDTPKDQIISALEEIKNITGKDEEKIIEAMLKSCPLCIDD